jgi:hypothetical protein
MGVSLGLNLAVVLSRLAAGWVFGTWNVMNDSGVAVKPWPPPAHLDFTVYKTHAATAWVGLGMPLELLAQWWGHDWGPALLWMKEQPLKPGPVYPALTQNLS